MSRKNGIGPSDVQPWPGETGGAPRTAAELQRFVRSAFRLHIPNRAICPGHDAPLDYLSASFLGQEDLLVWANRGGGKTLLAAVATILDAVFHAPSQIRVLGGSFDQSDRLAEYIREMLLMHPGLVADRMTRQVCRLAGGSEIRMLAQSQRAVRGLHVQKIRCDEVDLFDSEVWRAVQFVTRSAGRTRGSIEVLSTLHRSGGLMQHLVAEAAAGSQPPPDDETPDSEVVSPAPGYRLIKWCLWEVIQRCPKHRSCEKCMLFEDCRGIAHQANGFFRIDDAIAIKARSSRAAWEAEMLCRGPHRDWLVFGEFDPDRHVREIESCPDWPLFRAIDFGYSSPLVCLW
ncbi:MAG: hypothetical protein SVT52_03525, partial [Planctomycetota bacterium]|nr:hypothetical protein [Planctomycetota bacterium]